MLWWMTKAEHETLVREYLRYLAWGRLPARIPATREEAKGMIEEIDARARTNPHWDAWETLDELVDSDPETAWNVTLNILQACDDLDFGSLGAGPLETMIWRHHGSLTDRFEERIVNDLRFRDAFTYVRMGGVPLSVQRRLNAALVQTGIDPGTLVEFDERDFDEP
jgi:hypothetical protein